MSFVLTDREQDALAVVERFLPAEGAILRQCFDTINIYHQGRMNGHVACDTLYALGYYWNGTEWRIQRA